MEDMTNRPEWATLPALNAAEPKALAEAVALVLDEKKGHEIKTLFVEDKTILADYFVLCTAQSNTHVKALTDEVEYQLEKIEINADRVEGRGSDNSWMVMDYGRVIVHIFSREMREFYNLDKLYSDTEQIKVED